MNLPAEPSVHVTSFCDVATFATLSKTHRFWYDNWEELFNMVINEYHTAVDIFEECVDAHLDKEILYLIKKFALTKNYVLLCAVKYHHKKLLKKLVYLDDNEDRDTMYLYHAAADLELLKIIVDGIFFTSHFHKKLFLVNALKNHSIDSINYVLSKIPEWRNSHHFIINMIKKNFIRCDEIYHNSNKYEKSFIVQAVFLWGDIELAYYIDDNLFGVKNASALTSCVYADIGVIKHIYENNYEIDSYNCLSIAISYHKNDIVDFLIEKFLGPIMETRGKGECKACNYIMTSIRENNKYAFMKLMGCAYTNGELYMYWIEVVRTTIMNAKLSWLDGVMEFYDNYPVQIVKIDNGLISAKGAAYINEKCKNSIILMMDCHDETDVSDDDDNGSTDESSRDSGEGSDVE